MTYRLTSAALRELREVSLHYDSKTAGLGSRFLDAVEDSVKRIQTNPEAWRRVGRRCRRCRVLKFPFGVLYEVKMNEILILAIMDLRRDPARWEDLIR